jgi:hypothetical protein
VTGAGLDILTPQLVVVRGPAGDTRAWARAWVGQSPRTRVRMCLADLAFMAHGGYGDARTDRIIAAARDGAVQALLHRGVSVVVDGTDVDDRTVTQMERVAWACAAKATIVDLRGPP